MKERDYSEFVKLNKIFEYDLVKTGLFISYTLNAYQSYYFLS